MDGKHTLQKTFRQIRHHQASQRNPFVGAYMQIGNWRLQENENGDLVAVHKKTNQEAILVFKIEEGSAIILDEDVL